MLPLYLFLGVAVMMLVIGYLAGRKQDDEGYNLYGRKLSKMGYVVSYSASYIGAGFFIAGTGYAYLYGVGALWLFIGMIFGIAIFGFFAKWLREKTKDLKLHTLPDFFEWRFGRSAAKVLTCISLLLMAGDMSIQLISGGKLLQSLGVLSYSAAIMITVVVVAIYLIFSGFRAVIWTDYVLMAAIILLTGILGIFSLKYFHPTGDQLNVFSAPVGTVIGFFLFGLLGPFSISTYYQRIFASKDPETAKKGTWVSGLAILIVGLILFVIGLAAKNLFPSIDPDLAFLNTIKQGGPAIALIGALLLWAALMSTLDTLAFGGSQIISKDLLGVQLSRRNVGFGIVALLCFALIIGFIIPSIMSVGILFLGGGLTIAPSAFFQWFIKELKQWVVILSILSGFAVLIILALIKGISPTVIVGSFSVSLITLLGGHFIGRLVAIFKMKKL